MDGYIVHVDGYTPLIDEVMEYHVHHRLECGWGVSQAKEHNHWFVQPLVSYECCLPVVFWLDKDLIISPLNVEAHEQRAISELVD